MALNFQSLRHEIERTVDELGQEFDRIKALILTEDDLKCLLFKRLSELPSLRHPQPTMNTRILASMVHAELPWYGRKRQLDIVPDITILEPSHLSILHGYHIEEIPRFSIGRSKLSSLPSKQFEFGGNAIFFELKFIRERYGITEAIYREKIQSDYEKIQGLLNFVDQQGRRDEVYAYQVIFNKTDKKCGLFEEFLDEFGEGENHRILYKSARLNIPDSRKLSGGCNKKSE